MIARLLGHAGFRVSAATTAAEVRSVMSDSAPERVLLLASSTMAAGLGSSFDALLRHDPRPLVALTCTLPEECPLHPGLGCPNMDCLRKPQDFGHPSLVARLNRILAPL
jgi:DNA-binding response OmpR family regulator